MPLAGFTVFHLWKNAAALHGREAFGAIVDEINALPYVTVLEVFFILIPILLHAVLGVLIVLDGKYNVGAYRHARNWMYTMQRASGIIAMGFLLYHLYELRFQKLVGRMEPAGYYDALCANLSSTVWGIPFVALLYIFGIAAVAFHLANGLWGFLCSWGITVSRRSQRLSASCMGVVGVLVFILGANTALYFATGSKFFVPTSKVARQEKLEHCPSATKQLPEPINSAEPVPIKPLTNKVLTEPTKERVPTAPAASTKP
ncbi:MAG: succinate dehydrogenase [Sorangium cellulosum]|nr:MAG: succinate dehydrogenase [Sorangium cellulosum]